MLPENANNTGRTIQSGIIKSIESDYINNIHSRVVSVSNGSETDIYSETQKMGYNIGTRENIEAWSRKLNKRLKPSRTAADILQQLVDEINAQEEQNLKQDIKEQVLSLNLKPTAHPAFMIDKQGKYYRFEVNKFILDLSILDVDTEGNYTVRSRIEHSNDILITKYNKEHKPIIFKIFDSKNKVCSSAQSVAKKLKMKQEFVKKYKIHGYCGKSFGVSAMICNLFSEPKPTGYYFDRSYCFFKWNYKEAQFELHERVGKIPGAPMISDYEFKEDVVVRTDYDGVGMSL